MDGRSRAWRLKQPVGLERLVELAPSLRSVVQQYGTPTYAYHLGTVLDRLEELRVVPARIFYSPKANPAPPIVRTLVELGCGVDACSAFDLALAAAVGADAASVSFCTHALSDADIAECAHQGAHVVVDSEDQLRRYRQRISTPAGLRINVEVAAGFHPHVKAAVPSSRFGLKPREALRVAADRSNGIVGLHCHIGSDVASPSEHLLALDRLLAAAAQLPEIAYVNLGGGYRLPFTDNDEPYDLQLLGDAARNRLDEFAAAHGRQLELRLEPGNYLVRDAGYLLVTVLEVRSDNGHRTVITDGSVNAVPGTLLYGTQHPVRVLDAPSEGRSASVAPATVVGCLMQPGDILAESAYLPDVTRGDTLVFGLLGAYSSVRCSTFNGRPLPVEVVIGPARTTTVVRHRQSPTELLSDLSENVRPRRSAGYSSTGTPIIKPLS